MGTSLVLLIASALTLIAALPCLASEEAIREHRMGTITVRAEPGTRVEVTQLGHEFWFGTAINASMFPDGANAEQQQNYLRILKENFNSVVHENALKWYSTERSQGETSYEGVDRMLAWCEEEGLRTRGHCLLWAKPRFVQSWLKPLPPEELRAALEQRLREAVSRYRGRIVEYDVNNEMLHGRFYADRLGEQIRVDIFKWAHEEDPNAPLFVNDYNILSGKDVRRYEDQIEWLLQQGAPVGGIGCQGHFGEDVDMQAVKAALNRLARFGLPIRVTEFDINTGDETKKAQLLEEFYRTCFAHPAVEGILMWGFWEGRHWRPKAALWRRDFTPTPSARAYRHLVFDEWWTRWQGKANADGTCDLPAFYGQHMVSADGDQRQVELSKSSGRTVVDFTL